MLHEEEEMLVPYPTAVLRVSCAQASRITYLYVEVGSYQQRGGGR